MALGMKCWIIPGCHTRDFWDTSQTKPLSLSCGEHPGLCGEQVPISHPSRHVWPLCIIFWAVLSYSLICIFLFGRPLVLHGDRMAQSLSSWRKGERLQVAYVDSCIATETPPMWLQSATLRWPPAQSVNWQRLAGPPTCQADGSGMIRMGRPASASPARGWHCPAMETALPTTAGWRRRGPARLLVWMIHMQ